jgi:hypothetical protein
MAWRTSNGALAAQISNQGAADFKAVNNLLTLQENHVEEFFTYHGEQFLGALERLIEDVVERVMSQMLVKLRLNTMGTSGELGVTTDSLREYEAITAENITLDIQNLLATAVNSEVIMQRKMAKAQYLESQGFSTAQPSYPQQYAQTTMAASTGAMPALPAATGMDPSQIQGGGQTQAINASMMQQQQAFSNASGYPIPPAGTDTMGTPYWIDQHSGQMTYTPPTSGLGLGQMISKGAAWAAWLA